MPLFGGDKAKEFFEAVRDKEFSRAERLLNDKNAGVGHKDKESGRTALHYAVIVSINVLQEMLPIHSFSLVFK